MVGKIDQMSLLPRSVPSAERMDAKSVLALLDRLDERSVECHSLMVVRHGRVVAEGWWAPYSRDRPHLLYSLTKSFISIAVGFAVADGLLRLDDRVVDLLDDHVPADVSRRARQLSVHHLLTMTTGHRADVLADAWALEPADLVKGFLRVPAQDPAGTRHAYNNPTSFVLARMVERVTGRSVPDLLDERGGQARRRRGRMAERGLRRRHLRHHQPEPCPPRRRRPSCRSDLEPRAPHRP